MNIKITKTTERHISETVSYSFAARQQLFPMLNNHELPYDLLHFSSTYMQQNNTAFFTAFDDESKVIGTIGLKIYDHRFQQFSYQEQKVCEVVKLHVSPKYRRLGLATKLISEITEYAKQQEVETLYLHTHPFLTGAKETWERNGFCTIAQEDIPVWKTIHMEKRLR